MIAEELRALVEVDTKKRAQESAIASARLRLKEKKDSLATIADKISDSKDAFTDARKTVDRLELDAKSMREEEKDRRGKLKVATKGSVCNHLQHELQEIESKELELENNLIQAWQTLEEMEKASNQTQNEATEQTTTGHNTIKKLEENIEKLDQELKTIMVERNEKINNLNEDWHKRYESMAATVSDPIVPIVNEMCSSCYYHATAQDAAQLRKGKILACKSCYRLLYLEAPPEETLPVGKEGKDTKKD